MTNFSDLMVDLKQRRDELRLQLHLGSKKAEEEWVGLTSEWDKFLSRTQFDKNAKDVGEAAREIGLKMKSAYDKMCRD